jgi:Mg-chelatase subunit ChlI
MGVMSEEKKVEQDERGAAFERSLASIGAHDPQSFIDGAKWQEARAASTSANVAQGAEAVATVKVYETYTGQNGWIEVTQEEYDRTKDKYEHRIRRVSAPPAQTALTDDARDALKWAADRAHIAALGKPIDGVEGLRWRTLRDLLAAAQSGDKS